MEETLSPPRYMRRAIVWLLAVLTTASGLPVRAQEAEQPTTLRAAGSASMVLLGQATRTHLVGRENLYSIALYGDAAFDRAQLSSPDVARHCASSLITRTTGDGRLSSTGNGSWCLISYRRRLRISVWRSRHCGAATSS